MGVAGFSREFDWLSLVIFYTRTCEVVYFIFFGGFEMGRNGSRLTKWVVPVNGGAAC